MDPTQPVTVVERKKAGRPPGFEGSSNRTIKYCCGTCGKDVGRGNVRAKVVSFVVIGPPRKTIRSRTVEWVCVPCMELDPDYDREPFMAAPGMRDTLETPA